MAYITIIKILLWCHIIFQLICNVSGKYQQTFLRWQKKVGTTFSQMCSSINIEMRTQNIVNKSYSVFQN